MMENWNGALLNYGASTSEDPFSEDENKDVSCAIELSLLGSTPSGAHMTHLEFSYDDDDGYEQLAEALEESLELSRNARAINRSKGRPWKNISSSLNIIKKLKHHNIKSWAPIWRNDIDSRMNLICHVCEDEIKTAWSTNAWGQTFCCKHKSDGSHWCCGCKRVKLGNVRFMSLNDCRKLCLDCLSVAVMDTDQSQVLLHEMYEFFGGLKMTVRKDIPFLLVDEHEMNKIFHKQESDKYSRPAPVGATTYHLQVVTSVTGCFQREENIEVIKEVQYLSCRHEVTSVLVLYGLPKLETGATLAHEMMHMWMRLEGYKGLDRKVEEGICEVMAHKWLDWHAFVGEDFMSSIGEQSKFLRNLKEDLKCGMETNFDLTYGNGFREAKWAIERYGLRYTMKHIAKTGKFPQ